MDSKVNTSDSLQAVLEPVESVEEELDSGGDIANEDGLFVNEYELDDNYASFLGGGAAEGTGEMEDLVDDSNATGLLSQGCVVG